MIMKRLYIVLLALAAGVSAQAQGVRKTADEFNKMSRSDTSLVVLQGVVSRMKGDQRGVFYLKDETGEAYVYGLVDGRPGSNVTFPQMGIVVGDTLTVSGRRTVYDGHIIEMAGGHLLRKADGPDHAAQLEKARSLDSRPTFRGSSDIRVFSEWVQARLKYPKEARNAGVEGTVQLQFVVGKNGGVQEVQVLKGVDPALDNEAVRVVRSSPKWKPGTKEGQPVRVTNRLSVVFSLSK